MSLIFDQFHFEKVLQDSFKINDQSRFLGLIEKFETLESLKETKNGKIIVVQIQDVQICLPDRALFTVPWKAQIHLNALKDYSFNVGDLIEFSGHPIPYRCLVQHPDYSDFCLFYDIWFFYVVYTFDELAIQQHFQVPIRATSDTNV